MRTPVALPRSDSAVTNGGSDAAAGEVRGEGERSSCCSIHTGTYICAHSPEPHRFRGLWDA